MMRAVIAMLLLATALFLSGCGGGGEGDVIIDNDPSSPVNDVASPPLDHAEEDNTGGDGSGGNSGSNDSSEETSAAVDLMSSHLQLDLAGSTASWNDVGATQYRILIWSDSTAPVAQTTQSLNFTIPNSIRASGGFVLVEAQDELGNGIFSNTQTVEAE